jgi:hypothetical protein
MEEAMPRTDSRPDTPQLPFQPSPSLAPFTRDARIRRQVQAMVQEATAAAPVSDAEVLKALRAIFPDSPLALRVAALAMLAERRRTL